jgi:hypothetical protein
MRIVFAYALLLAGCRFEIAGFTPRGEPNPAAPDLASPSKFSGTHDMTGAFAPIQINVNGPALVGVEYPGLWMADPGVGGICGPGAGFRGNPVHGTADGALFQGYVLGNPLTCRVGPLTPGAYRVRLYFAEVYWGPGCAGGGPGVGARVFDIALEGATVLQNFDIFKEGGCVMSAISAAGMPVVKEFTVDVNDGILDVAMRATADQPLIAALAVLAD